MSKEYWLMNKQKRVLNIVIQEDSKELFKQMMGWDEKTFNENTAVRHLLSSTNKAARKINATKDDVWKGVIILGLLQIGLWALTLLAK